MLRNLFNVTARSGSQSLFAKPRGSVNVLSHRSFYPKSDRAIGCTKDSWSSEWPTMYQQSSYMKDIGNRDMTTVNRATSRATMNAGCNENTKEDGTTQLESLIRIVSETVLLIAACICVYRYFMKDKLAKLKTAKEEKACKLNKTVFSYDQATMMHKATLVHHIRLPNAADSGEVQQICDSLKRHGIIVDRSYFDSRHFVFSYRLECRTEYEVITRDKDVRAILEDAIVKLEEMEAAHSKTAVVPNLH